MQQTDFLSPNFYPQVSALCLVCPCDCMVSSGCKPLNLNVKRESDENKLHQHVQPFHLYDLQANDTFKKGLCKQFNFEVPLYG